MRTPSDLEIYGLHGALRHAVQSVDILRNFIIRADCLGQSRWGQNEDRIFQDATQVQLKELLLLAAKPRRHKTKKANTHVPA